MIVNDNLESIGKELILASFELQPQNVFEMSRIAGYSAVMVKV
jgi:hypothetical protein